MAEIKTDVTNNENMGMELDPAEQLRELKANYVPKEQLEQALAERNRYFKMATTNYQEEKPVEKKPKDIKELRQNLFNIDTFPESEELHFNLNFAKNALDLRTALMEKGEIDPFIPQGRKIAATTADRYAAQRIADGLEYCIEQADDDPDAFMATFNKIII